MDDELRQALGKMSGLITDAARDARTAAQQSAETSRKTDVFGLQIKEVKEELAGVKQDVAMLKTQVFGSNPPPPPSPPDGKNATAKPKPASLAQRVTNNDGDIAEISGQVLGVKADVADVMKINETQSESIERVEGKVNSLVNEEKTGIIDKQGKGITDLEKRFTAVETKVNSIHTAVGGFFNSPKVKFVGKTIFVAALTYAATKGWIHGVQQAAPHVDPPAMHAAP